MIFVKIVDGKVDQYPYSIEQLRQSNPNTSLSKHMPRHLLASLGVYSVTDLRAPEIDQRLTKLVKQKKPSLVKTQWLLGWDVIDKTVEEVKQHDASVAEGVREKRNELLSSSDWVVISYSEKSLSIPDDWEKYRNALRNITDHTDFPYLADEDWPTKP